MAIELSTLVAEYVPPPLGPEPSTERRERLCEVCCVNLFDQPHDPACPRRHPPLVRFLALDPAGHRLELELLRCTELALRRWLASGRSTAHEGPRQ